MPFLKYFKARAHASPPQPVSTPSEFPGRVTIGELSDNVLLNIFRYYLNVSPRCWPRLVHICRRWRRIVFASQWVLHLRIFCTHGASVLKTLDCWPALPIVVQYGGSLELGPPTPEDEVNIVAALKQSDRVTSISLTATHSLLKKLSSIKTPFSELEDLVLLSRDGVRLTLSSDFRWGPRLRCLHSTRIIIPALPQLLYSSRNLVDLQLHEGHYPWHLSPEALTNALSRMAQLRSLSLHFLSTTNYLDPQLPSRERFVLPVLTRLNIRGDARYLERLVAWIDAPCLGDIEVTFLDTFIVDVSKLGKFIDRIEMHKSYRRAHIVSSERAISISLMRPGAPACLKFPFLHGSLRDQLSSMNQICICFSALLSNVEDLRVSVTRRSRSEDSLDYEQWLRTINSFAGVKHFHVAGNLSMNIVHALQLPDMRIEIVLPALHKLYIPRPGTCRAPLPEAVVSFMILRGISGFPIMVEYEPLGHIGELRRTDPSSQQVTIEMLSDDLILNIFRYYLDAAPRAWPMLTYVCQRWRQIVHTSPLGLNIRLYFTPGTPVLKALDCWSALPIMVQYGGFPNLDPPAPEDDDNIIVALKQPGRISAVNLTVTSSLLDKLSAISEPFLELEELVLLSRDSVQFTLPSTFRWGPRLRTLYSTRIAFPSLPQILSPSHDLVDIQLHEIFGAGYFPPEVFANALSEMTNLRTLSLHFLSLPPRRNHLALPLPLGERVVLPALTFLKYRGTSKYLDSLVARIDAPRLGDIDITLFSQPTMDASELGRFIERTEMQTSLSQVEVQTSRDAISISFTSSGTSTPLRLQISCKQLDWQLSSMAQVCGQFSSFLSRVNNLRINMAQSSSDLDDADGEQWLGFVRAFGGTTDFQVAHELTTAVLCALGLVDGGHANVLPSLRHLHIENPMAINEPSWDSLLSFITLRSRPSHPVQVNVPFNQCHICYASFRGQKGLNRHLVDEHAYRILCTYCGNFEYKAGHKDLFRKHLRNEHPDARRGDVRIWNASLTDLQLDSLIAQHSSLRAPDVTAPSTQAAVPHFQ